MAGFSVCVLLATLGIFVIEGPFKDRKEPIPTRKTERKSAPETAPQTGKIDAHSSESLAVEAPELYVPTRPQTGICAGYDTVEHPEKILDILTLASKESCREIMGVKICAPVEILYAIWRIETGHVDGNGKGSGKCDVMEELVRRCKVGSAGGCKEVDANGRPSACKKPEACHYFAMERMAKHFDWNAVYGPRLERMTCSCPKIVDDVDPATGEVIGKKKYGYGGCCGPFQFSGAEIDDWAIDQNLDPLTFCGGAIIAAQDIVARYERAVKKGYAHGAPAWRRAISSYYGKDPKSEYYLKALSQWETIYNWQACELQAAEDGAQSWVRKSNGEVCDEAALERQWEYVRSKIVEKSMKSVRYHQSLRQ